MMQRTYPKRQKYSLRLPYSPHQNVPSHARTYNSPVHHSGSPRRFLTPENNCLRSYNSPEMRNGDNAVSSPPFYHLSPKYQRTNISDKHPSNRQNNEPYWIENLKHEPSDASHYSPKPTIVSEKYTYSPGQTREPYWADTVGRKANNTSPKLIHVSEKRPTRQTKEPYWMESFEHYELSSHPEDLQEADDFAQPPMVHRELPTSTPQCDRSLSYRFPIQDPQCLRRCVSSLKRKHQETTTHDVKISKLESSESKSTSTKKTECSKEANTQSSSKSCGIPKSNSEGSSQSNSIVATYDGNGNFIVVSKASSTVTTSGNNQTLSSSFLDRFENDPEEDDIELVSFDVQELKVETTCKDKVEEQQSSLIRVESNHGSNDQSSKEIEVEKSKTNIEVLKIDSDDAESLKTCAKVENDETESLSEAESEVFDDIFLKTISKELENDAHWSEEATQPKESGEKNGGADFDYNDDEPSRSEGSISPTFDSTLLRYLDDNIRNRIENRELSSHAKEVGDGDKDQAVGNKGPKPVDDSEESDSTIIFPEAQHERSVLGKTCDELASNGDTKETKNDRDQSGKSSESASSQLCIGSTVEKSDCTVPVAITKVPDSEDPQQRVVEENKKDSCTPVATNIPQSLNMRETKNDGVTIPKISDEKDAETLLQFDQESLFPATVQECASTKIDTDTSLDEMPLSYRQKLSQNFETRDKTLVSTDNHTVEGTGKIPISSMASRETTNGSGSKDKTKTVRETDNFSTNVQGAEASLDQRALSNRMTGSSETIANSEISSREQCQDSENNMPDVAPTLETSTDNDMNVDEAIKFIREKCEGTVKKSVKRFESVVNKPTEAGQEMTTNETDKTSESKEGNKEPQQMMSEEDNSSFDMSNSSIEDNNSAFVPLCERFLQSVKQELHGKEEKSKNGNSQTNEGDNSCGTKDTFSAEKNTANVDISEAVSSDSSKVASSGTTQSQESSTYNMLHSAVLASKMVNLNIPNQSSHDNEDVSSKDTGKVISVMSHIEVARVLVSKILSEKPKPFEESESVSMSKAIEVVEGKIKDPETSMTNVSNNLDSRILREKAKTSKELEVEVCNIDTKAIQISNATEGIKDIGINDPDMPKDLMAGMSKPLGLEKEITLSKRAIEPKGENCNPEDLVDMTTVPIGSIAKNDPDICKTHGLEIHKAYIEIESEVSSSPEEMAVQTSKKNADSDVQNCDRKDAEIESSNTNDIFDPHISKSSEAAVKVSDSLDIEDNNQSQGTYDETHTGSKPDIEIPSQISEATDEGAKHLTKDLQMLENPEISEMAEPVISQNRANSSSNDSLTTKLEAMTSDVEMSTNGNWGLPTPDEQATRGVGPNSIGTEDSERMETDDSDLRIVCNAASGLPDDETPQATENQEKAVVEEISNSPVANSPAYIVTEDETQQATQNQEKAIVGEMSNLPVAKSPASTMTENETQQASQNQDKAVVGEMSNSCVVGSASTMTEDETQQESHNQEKAVMGEMSNLPVANSPASTMTEDETQQVSHNQEKAVVGEMSNSRVANSPACIVTEGETQQESHNQEKAVMDEISNSRVAKSPASTMTEDEAPQASQNQDKAVVGEMSNLRVVGPASTMSESETPQESQNKEKAVMDEISNSRIAKSPASTMTEDEAQQVSHNQEKAVVGEMSNSRVVGPASTMTESETPQQSQNQEKAVMDEISNSLVANSPACIVTEGETQQATQNQDKADVREMSNLLVANSPASTMTEGETPQAIQNQEKAVVGEMSNLRVANSSASTMTEDETQQASQNQEKAIVGEMSNLLVGPATTTIQDETPQVSEEEKQADVEGNESSKSDSSGPEAVKVHSNSDADHAKVDVDVDVEHKNISKSDSSGAEVLKSKVHSNSDAIDCISFIEDKIPQVSKEKEDVEHKNNSTSDSSDTVVPKRKFDKDTSKPTVKSRDDNDDTVAVRSSEDNDDPVKSNDNGDDTVKRNNGTFDEVIVLAEQQETSNELKIPEQQKNNDSTMEEDLTVPVEIKLEENLTSPDESKLENDSFVRNESNHDDLLVSKLDKVNDQDIDMMKKMISKLLVPDENFSFFLEKYVELNDKVDKINGAADFDYNDNGPSRSEGTGLTASVPPSPDSVMTDSENSSASSEDAYVQSLIARARQLSDMDLSSLESSDIEMGMPPDLSGIQEGSMDTELTNDCALNKASQKCNPEMDSTRNESSDIVMAVLSHPPETHETDVPHNELAKDLVSKKAGEKSDTEMDKTSNQSSVIETYNKTGTHELTKDLDLIHEDFISLSKELKQRHETLVCNSSTQERQTTRTSVNQSRVSRRVSIKERKEVSKNIKEVYKNGTDLSKYGKGLSKNNNETSISNQELSINNKTPRKRGRPPKRSYQMLVQKPDNQEDVSAKKPERRSPRQEDVSAKKPKRRSPRQILCSRAIPYRRDMFKTFNLGRSKDSIKLEKNFREKDGETFELNVDQVIDIVDVCGDVDDFHLKLDDASEEDHWSPDQLYNFLGCPSNEKTLPQNSLGSSISLQTTSLPASSTKPIGEAVIINRTNSGTRGETTLKERTPRGSLPQGIDNSVAGNSSQGGALPNQLGKSLTIPRIMMGATPNKSIAETSSLKSSLADQTCNPPSSSTTPRRSTCATSLREESPASDTIPLCSLGASNNVDRNENESSKSLAEESSMSDLHDDRSSTRSEVCVSLGTAKPDEGRLTGSMSSEMTRDKSLPENMRLSISEVPSASTSNGLHTSLGSSKPSERSQSLDGSDENLVPTSADFCSSNGSSLPTSPLSQNMEDISSSTGYSSTSTAIMDSQESSIESNERHDTGESLKITLISETDPNTGKTNWTQSPGKLTESAKKEPCTGYGLRPSKTRKTKHPSPTPTDPHAKRRRITTTDPRVGTQSPQALHHLAKRPLEKYIRNVEKVYRTSDKNPKKGSLSIAMNDHVSKTASQDQEGDYLKLGDTDVMYEIVKKACDESKFKRSRPSPRSLYFAAKQGNVLQVLVLAAGCNVNATIPQEKHKTAMHSAAGAGHAHVLRLLCMIGGNLSCLDTNLQTPLFDAVENQQTQVVKYLISQDVNLNLKDSQGMTVLHVAAQKSNLEIINLLMDTRKMSVNEQDSGGWTALMWTAEGKRTDVAKCLLKWGADVNILDSEQNTCLHWAALAGGTEIMDLLLESNVHIDARNMFGATALHISAREKKLPNLKTLEKYRPNMEIRNAEGKKALELVPHNSRCYRQLEKMEMLMSFAMCTLKQRLISRDISRGQEKRPIPCINE
ncbi:histone-lysine N-methyltransferase EHMT2-like isoform X4, partial [Paramuricea clavata]